MAKVEVGDRWSGRIPPPPPGKIPTSPTCDLNSKGCLTLSSLLKTYSVLSEEHAWALCYQSAKCCKSILEDATKRSLCFLVTESDHVLIHKDGHVHPDTFLDPETSSGSEEQGKKTARSRSTCACKIIAKLAEVIFHALDFGLAEDEERPLSAELESLLDAMASAGEMAERPETDDEGIERDSGDSDDDRANSARTFNFDNVLEICTRRLGSSSLSSGSLASLRNGGGGASSASSNSSNGGSGAGVSPTGSSPAADAHYKAVCRALVTEALDLSSFLQKVAQGTQTFRTKSSSGGSYLGYSQSVGTGHDHDPDLDKLDFTDWAVGHLIKGLVHKDFGQYSRWNVPWSRRNGVEEKREHMRLMTKYYTPGKKFNAISGLYDFDISKIYDVKESADKKLEQAARLWVQVIRELRNGVKLKKVESHDCSRGPPIEYELTPYEILMDDIRSRRYKLNKVMVDGALPPRIKKDAHAIILEFIRSRPPLKKVSDRVLPPPPKKVSNPIELLMESIRQEHHLRPISRRRDSHKSRGRRLYSTDMTENNGTANGGKVSQNKGVAANGTNQLVGGEQPQRRLIKADLDLLYSFDSKDDDDDEEEGMQADSGKENGDCFFGHICPEGTQSTPVTPWKQPSEPKFEDDESTKPRIDTRRRHSICNPTNRDEHGSTLITFPFEYTNSVNVFSSLQCPRASPMLHRRKAKLPHSVSKSCLQEEFFQSNHWQTAIECLSLNLEEVVHIRNVLTKAELESLPVDCSLKEDVEKGKVCFLCLKTRFSLFLGPWGNVCKLCKRTVCAKCCEKMRIPTEHFAKVPVSTLSPNISPRDEEKDLPGSRNSTSSSLSHSNSANLPRKNSVGSAPTSPNLPRKADSGSSSINSDQRSTSPGHNENEERDKFPSFHGHGPHSLPTVTSISLGLMAFKRRGFGRSKEADKTEKLKGSLMVVCHDCKVMVLQIIRSSRAKKASAAVRGGMTLTFVNPLKS